MAGEEVPAENSSSPPSVRPVCTLEAEHGNIAVAAVSLSADDTINGGTLAAQYLTAPCDAVALGEIAAAGSTPLPPTARTDHGRRLYASHGTIDLSSAATGATQTVIEPMGTPLSQSAPARPGQPVEIEAPLVSGRERSSRLHARRRGDHAPTSESSDGSPRSEPSPACVPFRTPRYHSTRARRDRDWNVGVHVARRRGVGRRAGTDRILRRTERGPSLVHIVQIPHLAELVSAGVFNRCEAARFQHAFVPVSAVRGLSSSSPPP